MVINRIKSAQDLLNKYYYILSSSQKKWGVVILIFTLMGALCETLGVSIILPLVQAMIAPQQLRENSILGPIIDHFNLSSDVALIWGICIAVISLYLFKNLFLLFLSYVRIKYACKVQRELSIEMIDSYMKRGYTFFLNTNTGELMRGATGSINCTYTVLYQFLKLIAEALTLGCICIFIMSTDPIMSMCVIGLALLCLVVIVLGCQKGVKKCGEINHKYSALVNTTLLQTFQGIKEILVMGRQRYFIDSYKKNYAKQQKGFIGQTVATESPTYIIEAVCVCALIIVVCLKATSTANAAVLLPQLASFAVAAFRILPSLGRISSCFNQLMFFIPGVNETYDNFKEARDKQYTEKATNEASFFINKQTFSAEGLDVFKNVLSIENITWRYPNTNNNVLENLCIEINKGQSIAFVGKSGTGKTTLADIILGLLIPQNGQIKIDGVDITNIPKERSHMVGFVPQNINLLDDTIRRNVAFGVSDKEIDDQLVWRALEQAQLKEIVEKARYGLDTQIGERGVRFSGGQRQRFAIARALYLNPDILILDEATSALDTETETAVMDAINALQGHKTMIIIAHRLTTIKNCDKIYEIVNGKAVERKYEELT